MGLASLQEQLVGHRLQPPTLLPAPASWEGSGNQEPLGSCEGQRSDRGFLPAPGNFLLPGTISASWTNTSLGDPSSLSTTPHSITVANGGMGPPAAACTRLCSPPGNGHQSHLLVSYASAPHDALGLGAVSHSVSSSLRAPPGWGWGWDGCHLGALASPSTEVSLELLALG